MSDSSDFSSESEVEYEPIVVEDLEGKKILMKEESNALAPVVIVNTKTADKSQKIKKSKVFATKDTMLNLIESLNTVQDTKIQQKLDRDASYLQRLTNIEKATRERKSMKTERLDKIKDNLRKGGVRVRGENKKIVRDIREKEEVERGGRNSRGSRGGRGSARGGSSRAGSSSRGSSSGSSRGGSSRGSSSGSSRGGSSLRGSSTGASRGGSSRGSSNASRGKIQKKVKFSV